MPTNVTSADLKIAVLEERLVSIDEHLRELVNRLNKLGALSVQADINHRELPQLNSRVAKLEQSVRDQRWLMVIMALFAGFIGSEGGQAVMKLFMKFGV